MTSKVYVALRVRASPERAFQAFVEEIGAWWRPSGLFQTTPRAPGVLAFEPGEGGRLTETLANGKVFEIGRITVWQPPNRLVFGWRQANFPPELTTEVEVGFEAAGEETRVSIEHRGFHQVPAGARGVVWKRPLGLHQAPISSTNAWKARSGLARTRNAT
jgi:uncharacterized protein YndB with AHSA1/START domain